MTSDERQVEPKALFFSQLVTCHSSLVTGFNSVDRRYFLASVLFQFAHVMKNAVEAIAPGS